MLKFGSARHSRVLIPFLQSSKPPAHFLSQPLPACVYPLTHSYRSSKKNASFYLRSSSMAFMYDASSDLALPSSAEKLEACVAATAWLAIRLASRVSFVFCSTESRKGGVDACVDKRVGSRDDHDMPRGFRLQVDMPSEARDRGC